MPEVEDDYKQRAIKERDELSEKVAKLKAYTETDEYKHLAVYDQQLLNRQLYFMQNYVIVLGSRIERFPA